MDKNIKDYLDLKKEIVAIITSGYESRERLILLSEIKNENNEKKVQSLIEISTQINQNSRNILNELSEVEDIDQIKDLKEKLLSLTECYRQLIEEIF